MELRDLRKVDVDYEYINHTFSLYCDWLDTGDESVYRQMATEAVPLVNVFLSVAIRRHNLKGSESTFDELYSYAYSTFLETVRKKKEYPEPNAFYAYMKTRVSYATFSYYMEEHVQSDELVSKEVVEFSQLPLGYGVDVSSISERHLKSYMRYFFGCYNEKEKDIFKYIILYFQQNRDEITPSLLEVKFQLAEDRAKQLVERGRILFRTILFFCLREGQEPHQYINKRGDTIMVSKYFLTLLTIEDKYPHLTELYSLLGDQTHDVMKILGGEKVKFPSPEELKKTNKEVSAVMDFLENPVRERLDEISEKNNIDRRRLNYILKSYKKKFKDVPFLGEELKAVDEVYS